MRTTTALAAALLVVSLTGCSTSDGTQLRPPASAPQDSTAPSVPPELKARPLRQAAPFDAVPSGLVDEASVERVTGLSRAGQGRLDAESFAVSFAQLIMDTRGDRDQSALVEDLGHDQLASEVRERLVFEYEQMHRARFDRHYDPEFPALMRSTFEGDEDAPDRVNVEVVAAMPLSSGTRGVVRMRVDVVLEQDRWKVIDIGGPSSTGALIDRPEELEPSLDGSAWRRLPD